MNDPARVSQSAVSEAVRDGEVLYASGEKVGSEYEAMDSQLTANLVMQSMLKRTYESAMKTFGTFALLYARYPSFIRYTVDCANAHAAVLGFGVRVDPFTEEEAA